MGWVYLSPHFDDVVLSCGGLVWEQVQAGQAVNIWTICAGAPPADQALSPFALGLHQRWQAGEEAVTTRRKEDEAALCLLGADARYWDLPDCIYRRLPDGPDGIGGSCLVNGEDDLWQPLHPLEASVVARLRDWLARELGAEDVLVSPLTLGNHVDHSLVRAAAEQAARLAGCAIRYYPDYPYAVKPEADEAVKTGAGWQKEAHAVSREGLRAWQDAVDCYTSQISTFWQGRAALDAALEAYWRAGGGTYLWRPGL